MNKAIITTSANPFHYGHLDIYNEAKKIFNDVKVIIAQNPNKDDEKNGTFEISYERLQYTI